MREPRAGRPRPQGPYRTAPERGPKRRLYWGWWVCGVAGSLGLVATGLGSCSETGRPALSSIPTGLFADVREWPPPEPELGPSTPVAPLLVAQQPESLAVLQPREGATRILRGRSLRIQFNRPMVRASQVGRPAPTSPLVFTPPVRGAATWTSRSEFTFQPEQDMWTPRPREYTLSFSEDLAALSGEVLQDRVPRVVVLDGAPMLDLQRSRGRVNTGGPLPLYFDAPVSVSALSRELLAYESGGGRRPLQVALTASASQPERGYRVDVRLRRQLEPGARVALALLPRYLAWGADSRPAVVSYQLSPPPQIEGVRCQEGAVNAGQCRFRSSPGQVVDIGPTLRLLSSDLLANATSANFRIRPAVRGVTVRLAPHGPPRHRLLELTADWEPDQVYEVRVSGLTTEQGQPLRALRPLAVRSSGHAPQIRVATGRLSFEASADAMLPFAAIAPAHSDVLYRAVDAGDEVRALISPQRFANARGTSTALATLATYARANRWGPGRFRWREGARADHSMAVVSFRPDPEHRPNAAQTAFVQSTDLGVSVRGTRDGLLVWVTRLSDGQPVSGARVVVADSETRRRADAHTDADGVAQIALSANPLVVSHAVLVTHGGDRAALLLDPRQAVGPASMGLTPGTSRDADAPFATVFTDRGAYRPGEAGHAKVVLRRVRGTRVQAVRRGEFIARLFAPGAAAVQREFRFHPSRFGTAALDFELPAAAAIGRWRLEVLRRGQEAVLGEVGLRVAQFRQPTFRVDVSRVRGAVHAGDVVGVDVSATYLFGAPVPNAHVQWSLLRVGRAAYPERWRRYRFAPLGAGAATGTAAAGEIDGDAELHVDTQIEVPGSTRTRFEFEAEVTDRAGHTHASRQRFTAYPADVEVGLMTGRDWVASGQPLEVRAVAIDHAGEPVAGRDIEVTFTREGWHSWWEWSESSRSRGGSYQLRRDRREQASHRCALRSQEEPVRCQFTPTRPGTYRLEVRTTDDAGRQSLANRRVYVAGPAEHPDRDPPGAPISVTPLHRSWTVGQTAELAFESPFERATALITVEREGVMHLERRAVRAGGQVIRVPLTAEMVPNALVSVTLVKPRDGEPADGVDLHAPDLRYGVAELRVSPPSSALEVTLELEASARPGSEVPITAQLRDAAGHPVRGEVALWVVDEGTLRLSAYQVPDLGRGLFQPRPAAFAWEDLRRGLVSRTAVPPMPRASGDGNSGETQAPQLDDRERFDPTPLWVPALVTDDDGRVQATLSLPARPTEYRVMAVALNDDGRSGGASAQLVAEQPVVIRPAFPRFVTAGDVFEASAFVHNTTDAPLEIAIATTVGEAAPETQTLTIPAGGERRVSRRVTAPSQGPMTLRVEARFSAEGNADVVAVQDRVGVMPRGRFVRSHVFGAAEDATELTVGLPEGLPDIGARAVITVASHPFIGFEGAIDGLLDAGWSTAEHTALTLLALSAYEDLGVETAARSMSRRERAARAHALTTQLADLQFAAGGFGRWSRVGSARPAVTAAALHALIEARRHGWFDATEAIARGAADLSSQVANIQRFAYYAQDATEQEDQRAYALRVLRLAERPASGAANEAYDHRQLLSPYGLAHLAMALGPGDSRSQTLLEQATDTVLAAPDDNIPRSIRWDREPARAYAATLEASSRLEAGHERAGQIAAHLLRLRDGRIGLPFGTSRDTSRALYALSAYAELWSWDEGSTAHVALDGRGLAPASTSRAGSMFLVPIARLRGPHQLRIQSEQRGAFFFSIDGRWAVPLTAADETARGRRAAVHRVYETPEGRPLPDGAEVPLGEMVRVRLFVYTEGSSPDVVGIVDPIPAGFEAVDTGLDSTPRASLEALFGAGFDQGAVDARAQLAIRCVGSVTHRALRTEHASFYFDRLPGGLQEYTYAIRATTVGEFVAPPTQLEAFHDPGFVARGAVNRLRVVERATPGSR